MWKYYNCNPLRREVNDCVVRAVSLAEGKSWDETYLILSKLALNEAVILDDSLFVEKYLNSKYEAICPKCEGYRITVGEFVKTHPKGTFLITMKGHITCVVDGIIYDTWDCTDKLMWNAWIVG
jgi:hypothetical protein